MLYRRYIIRARPGGKPKISRDRRFLNRVKFPKNKNKRQVHQARIPGLARRLVKPLFTIYLFAIYSFAVAFADFLITLLTMQLTKRCQFNGQIYTMDFPTMTASQYYDAREKWRNGALIQEAFFFLTASEREFIMTGTPPHVWEEMFAEHGL